MMANLESYEYRASRSRVWHATVRTACSFAVLLGVGSSAHAGDDCGVAGAVTEVAAGVFVRPGAHHPPLEGENIANIGFIVGDRCVAVIDSGASIAEGEALQCAVAAISDLPICYLILTHHHYDHVMGNLAFKQSSEDSAVEIEIIGHEKLAPALLQSAEYYRTELSDDPARPLSPDQIVLPDSVVPVAAARSLDLGGRELLLVAHPPAHTNNDLSVIDSKTNTLWLGDLMFVDHVPALDASLGSINGWIDAIDTMRTETAPLAVPGHGPASVPWPGGSDDLVRYLTVVRDQVRELIAANGSIQEAQDSVGVEEADRWEMFEHHHKRTIIRAFTELEWE